MRQRRSWARRLTYDLSRIAARVVGVIGFRIRCYGRDNFPSHGGALVCSNHQSYLDPVLVGLACDRRLNYLARETLFRFAPFRWLIRWYDAIPIQQDGLGIGGLKETLRRLKRGELVLIFPEGTRSADGRMGPLQPGFCALARRGAVPLLPVGIDGAFEVWPRSGRFPKLAAIAIHVGQPISAALVEELSDDGLMRELAERIASCHAKARKSRLNSIVKKPRTSNEHESHAQR